MSTTIDRTGVNVTNDSGTELAPAGDGTLWNAAWVTTLCNRIDGCFSSSFAIGGVVTVSGFGTHTLSAGGTGQNSLAIRNTTSGTSNGASITLGNDATASLVGVFATSSSFTPSGPYFASGGSVESTGAGGLSLIASHASGAVRLYSGASTLRLYCASDGLCSVYGVLNVASSSGLPANWPGGPVLAWTSPNSDLLFGDGTGYVWRLATRSGSVTTPRLTVVDNGAMTFTPGGTTTTMTLNAAADPWIQLASAAAVGSMSATNLFLESIYSNAATSNHFVYGWHTVQTAAATSNTAGNLAAYTTHTYTSGTTGTGYALFAGYEQAGTGGTCTTANAVGASMFASAGTITSGIGVSVAFPTTSGTITNGYGVKVGIFGAGVTNKWAFYCDDTTAFSLIAGGLQLNERSALPSSPAADGPWQIVAKGDKLIFVFNNGGTVKYWYIDGTGTGSSLTYTTTAP